MAQRVHRDLGEMTLIVKVGKLMVETLMVGKLMVKVGMHARAI